MCGSKSKGISMWIKDAKIILSVARLSGSGMDSVDMLRYMYAEVFQPARAPPPERVHVGQPGDLFPAPFVGQRVALRTPSRGPEVRMFIVAQVFEAGGDEGPPRPLIPRSRYRAAPEPGAGAG